jgi:outer membrane protein assembly factor BamB
VILEQFPGSLRRRFAVLSVILCGLIVAAGASRTRADAWPRFRGPNGEGQGAAAGIPAEWTEEDYQWTVDLPGLGHSSPVVWEDRVFVTSADPETGEQLILCFALETGEELWRKTYASSPHAMHATNSFATSTPAVDADAVYCAWKSADQVVLVALSHAGEQLWRRDVAHQAEHHGFGASPVVAGDVVCLTNETDVAEDSAVYGFDRRTGEQRWRRARGAGKTVYATPVVVDRPAGGQLLLLASMADGLTALDPASGEVLWNVLAHDLPDRTVSSPIVTHGLALVSCGSGNNGLHLIAVKLGDGAAAPAEAYRVKQGVPNIPTPVVAEDLLFLWHDRGTVSCLDAATGERHWLERVGGRFHSSPVHVGDRIYCTSLEGEVVVLAASDEFKVLARNSLGDACTATPACADGRLIFRTEHKLLCLGAKP